MRRTRLCGILLWPLLLVLTLSCNKDFPIVVVLSVTGIPADATTLRVSATLAGMTAQPEDFPVPAGTTPESQLQVGLRIPAALRGPYQAQVSALRQSACPAASGQGSMTLSGNLNVTVPVALSPLSAGAPGQCPVLTVARTGTGTGTVTSTPAGIQCGAQCSLEVPAGTQLVLRASADADGRFSGWSGGACTGTGDCTLVVRAATQVGARFDANRCNPVTGVCWENPRLRGYKTYAAHGSAATDVWAVGEQGQALRYDGAAWAEVPTGVDRLLRGVYSAGPKDVWAVGETVLHYDGTRWSEVDVGLTGVLYGVSGVASNDIWAVGYDELLHYDGTQWTRLSANGRFLTGVHARPSGEVWTVDTDGQVLRKPSGSALFTAVGTVPSAPGVVPATPPVLRGVWAADTNDAWIVGEGGDSAAGAANGGVVYRWNGTSWAFVSTPARAAGLDLYAVSGVSPTQVYAAGDSGLLLFYNGSAWTQQDVGADGPMAGVWARSADEVWVPVWGSVLRGKAGGPWGPAPNVGPLWSWNAISGTGGKDLWVAGNAGMIARYDGSAWSLTQSGTDKILYGVWAGASNDVWAVGNNGVAQHFDGQKWQSGTAGTGNFRTSVWGSSGTDVWTAGGGGVFTNWNGSTWTKVSAPSTERMNGLSGTGPKDVWAVGDNGTAEHWDGTGWQEISTPVLDNLYAVWAGAKDVWAVGAGPTVLRYSAGTFDEVTGPFNSAGSYLDGVWKSGSGDVWVAGDGGVFRSKDNGATWSVVDFGATFSLAAMFGVGAEGPWAAGRNGTVLRLPR